MGMFSSTSESRAQEDLSTTGCLGDTEGMDSIIVQADLDQEELTSSAEPWPQQPEQKRRRLSNEKDMENKNVEEMETEENSVQAPMVEASNNENPRIKGISTNETPMTGTIPKKKEYNETLELEKQREAMAQEIKILREQNKIQLEQH